MSLQAKENIKCPHCAHESEYEYWRMINIDINPELREKINSGELWEWTCPHCGYEAMLPWETIYLDMEHKFMIFFDAFEPENGTKYDGVDIQSLVGEVDGMENYTFRAVYDLGLNSLREKILILENGLNDIAVERLRYMIATYLRPSIALEEKQIYLTDIAKEETEDYEFGKMIFTVIDGRKGEVLTFPISMSVYYEHNLAVKLDPRMSNDTNICIDAEWMKKQMTAGKKAYVCRMHAEDVVIATTRDKYGNRLCGLEDKQGNELCQKICGYIHPAEYGYFVAEKGARKNLLRPDGSFVFDDWYNDIFGLTDDGFFAFSNTKRKTKNTPTQYLGGVAHVDGRILLPFGFQNVGRKTGEKTGFAFDVENVRYYLHSHGGVYDVQKRHLPKGHGRDVDDALEKVLNWTLPGLQFYYMDTDICIDERSDYHPGNVIKAAGYVYATTKLGRPAHRTRFIIASAHAAKLCDLEGYDEKAVRQGLVMFHYDSYFYVVDAYRRYNDDVTQILLLHIPPTAVNIFSGGKVAINFFDKVIPGNPPLKDLARQSLDEKMEQEVHERSCDMDLLELMKRPIGMLDNGCLEILRRYGEPSNAEDARFSQFIHELAEDADVDKEVKRVEDNFPYGGVEDSVCDGCIYAAGIVGNGERCGRFFKDEFRKNYQHGLCREKRTSIFRHSLNEWKHWDDAAKEERQTDEYATNMVRDFINEVLDGDIDRLKDFDFTSDSCLSKYDSWLFNASDIIRALMTVLFADVWNELNFENSKYKYVCSRVNDSHALFGENSNDKYLFGMNYFDPTPEQTARGLKVWHLCNTLGNLWILPSSSPYVNTNKYKGYADKYIQQLHHQATSTVILKVGQKKMPMCEVGFYGYAGQDGFDRFLKEMMLENFEDASGQPVDVCELISTFTRNLDKERYFDNVDKFCTFCESYIPQRTERLLVKLKKVLHWGKPQEKKVESVIIAGVPFPLPVMYEPVKALPDDVPGQVTVIGQTENALCVLKIIPAMLENIMPFHNLTSLIEGIHQAMSEKQGLIEVNSVVSKNENLHIVYSIVKRFNEELEHGVSYTLRAHLLEKGKENHPYEILGFFEEAGMTGVRDSMVYAMPRRENRIDDELNEWNVNLYDPSFEKGNRMNQSEAEVFDLMFPAHPLSQCRSLIKFLIASSLSTSMTER